MGFFNNLAGMGPEGGPAPEPRTALGRFWRICTHHFRGLLGSGLLACVTALVYIAALLLGTESHGLIFVLIGGPLGGMIAMPQIAGVADTALRAIRGEAGFWWMKYRRAWKRNLRQSALFGSVVGLLCSVQCFMLHHAQGAGTVVFALMLAGIFVTVAAAGWSVPQIALMELPLGRILLNSLALSARHPIRTLLTVAVTVAYWLAMVVLYPFSLPVYVLLGFWFPMLVCLMIQWGPIDEIFDITGKLEELNAGRRAEEKAHDTARDEARQPAEEE